MAKSSSSSSTQERDASGLASLGSARPAGLELSEMHKSQRSKYDYLIESVWVEADSDSLDDKLENLPKVAVDCAPEDFSWVKSSLEQSNRPTFPQPESTLILLLFKVLGSPIWKK